MGVEQRWDPTSYEGQLERGLKLSGEDASYFASHRVQHVAARCAALGLSPRAVCEFGCGTGQNLPFLGGAFPGARLWGIDPSARMRKAAEDRLGDLQVSISSLEACELKGAELVFVNGVMHHVEPADRTSVMGQIKQLLAPGGLLALFDNNPLNPGAMWVMRRIEFDRDASPVLARTLSTLARRAGLADIEVRTHFYFPRALGVLRPLEPWLERLPLGAQYVLYARRPA